MHEVAATIRRTLKGDIRASCGRPVPSSRHGICDCDLGFIRYDEMYQQWTIRHERNYRKRDDGCYEIRERGKPLNKGRDPDRRLPISIVCPSCRFLNNVPAPLNDLLDSATNLIP